MTSVMVLVLLGLSVGEGIPLALQSVSSWVDAGVSQPT